MTDIEIIDDLIFQTKDRTSKTFYDCPMCKKRGVLRHNMTAHLLVHKKKILLREIPRDTSKHLIHMMGRVGTRDDSDHSPSDGPTPKKGSPSPPGASPADVSGWPSGPIL